MKIVPHPAKDNAEDHDLPIVAPGDYTMTYVKHHFQIMWGRGVLMVTFTIIDLGKHFETRLVRHYNCRRTAQRKIKARPSSALQREFTACTGIRRQPRGEIPITALKDVPVIAKVSTVKKDHRQNELHELNRYSKVECLKGRANI